VAAGKTAAAVVIHFKSEFELPSPIRNAFANMGEVLARMDRVTGPACAAAVLSVYVHVVKIDRAAPELRNAPSIFGSNHLAPVATEAQLIGAEVERRVEQVWV